MILSILPINMGYLMVFISLFFYGFTRFRLHKTFQIPQKTSCQLFVRYILPFLHLQSHIISKLWGLKGWAYSKVQEMKLLLVLNFHLETPFAHLEIQTLISLSLSPQKTYSPQGEKETWPGRVRWIQYKYMVRLNHAKFSVI